MPRRMEERSTFAKYWWLALLGICVLPCVLPIACKRDPEKVLSRIPIGSKLTELDELLSRDRDDEGEVTEWIPASKTLDSRVKLVTNEFGVFIQRDLGSYDGWSASATERNSFTGKITFFHHSWVIPDDLAPSYVIDLIYINGELKAKNWGILPG